MKFHCITLEERLSFQSQIASLEQIAKYPLGKEFFQIDHGENYFAFFDRLGEVNYYVALDNDRVVAVGAGILRQIRDRQDQCDRFAWYLCDLKVHPDYQRRYLSLRILSYAIPDNILRCDRGYAILMNSSNGRPSRLAQIYERFRLVKFHRATSLNLYSFDAENMDRFSSLLIEHRGAISYLSLQGIKDLRLTHTREILPLLHVQWGATANQGNSTPLPGHIHMFCAPVNDKLAIALTNLGIFPMATATVVSHGMAESDWQFILTSEI